MIRAAFKCPKCGGAFQIDVQDDFVLTPDMAHPLCPRCAAASSIEGTLGLLVADVKYLRDSLTPLITERDALVQKAEAWRNEKPIDLVIYCPNCEKQHLDIGEFRERVHRKHLCENTPEGPKTGCGELWVPHWYATRGVEAIELERLDPRTDSLIIVLDHLASELQDAIDREGFRPNDEKRVAELFRRRRELIIARMVR